jgi:nucleotide-binding universal stress UspA family protein
MFQRPLICTDFADHLDRLTHFVPSLVAGGMQHIVFLHNVPLSEAEEIPRPHPEKLDHARQKLAPALQQVPDGATVEIAVHSGKPVDGILQAATKYQSDVIILGTPSRNLLTEKLFGSNTVALAQRSPIPLMVLRPQLIATYTAAELTLRCQQLFQSLLLPYDDSSAAQYTLTQLQQVLQKHPDRPVQSVICCSVIDVGGHYEQSAEQQQQVIQASLAPRQTELANLGLAVTLEVRLGNPIHEILAAAQDHAVSAIALSSNNLNSLLRFSAPSVAAEILRQSWHPVIFFPPQRA